MLNLKLFNKTDIKFRKYNSVKNLYEKQEITSMVAKFSFNSRKRISYINSTENKGIFNNYFKHRSLKRKKKLHESRKSSEIYLLLKQ